MKLGELRKITHQLVPEDTPVMAYLVDDEGELESMLTVKGAEYDQHEDGTWILWIDCEES